MSTSSRKGGRTRPISAEVSTPLIQKIFEGYLLRKNKKDVDDDVVLIEDDSPAAAEQPFNADRRVQDGGRYPKMRLYRSVNQQCRQFHELRGGEVSFKRGDFVSLRRPVSSGRSRIVQLIYFYDDVTGGRQAHVQVYLRAQETLLGEAGNDQELFQTSSCENIPADAIQGHVDVHLVTAFDEPAWRRVGGTAGALNGLNNTGLPPQAFICQKQFDPISGRYTNLIVRDEDSLCFLCKISQEKDLSVKPRLVHRRLLLHGRTYGPNDAVYLTPGAFPLQRRQQELQAGAGVPPCPNERRYPEYYRYFLSDKKVKGDISGIAEPLQVGIIQDLQAVVGDVRVQVRALLRPENTSMSSADVSKADLNLLFWTNEFYWVRSSTIEGGCFVTQQEKINVDGALWGSQGRDRFYFAKEYDSQQRIIKELSQGGKSYNPPNEAENRSPWPRMSRPKFRALDLFSGCGGLAKGLEMADCAEASWAIEVDPAAAEAFRMNFPKSRVFCEDANVILGKLLAGRGHLDRYPNPGEVELICSGPPCQGFSGLNSFPDRASATANNAQMATCLSYVDYYRPKYFLMENVKKMLSHDCGRMCRTLIKALLAMQYQVTIGVLQCGSHLVPQDRHRAFVLAAAPSVELPFLPQPECVFVRPTPSTTINGVTWTPNPSMMSSAPLRHITTRDAISDLPRVHSGAEATPLSRYRQPPQTHFQKLMRRRPDGSFRQVRLHDHVTKGLTAIDKARISLIPVRPGSDWRDLPNIVWQFPDGSTSEKLRYLFNDADGKDMSRIRGVCPCMTSRKMGCNKSSDLHQRVTLIPWAMVHTASRNNNWSGCYGRVDWTSYFSTMTTDPDPQAKQGRVVHPDKQQNRLLSVRECARAQGMADDFRFYGSIKDKFRQIGNAVPPPLAAALGRQICMVNQ